MLKSSSQSRLSISSELDTTYPNVSEAASCCCDGVGGHSLSRSEFLRLAAGTLGATGLSTLLAGCNPKTPKTTDSTSTAGSKEEPTLRIGYLPITDAAPLLIGHAKGFFEREGLRIDRPVLVRGWPELTESFLQGSFNFVHMLMPIPIQMRFAQKHDVKIVAWNHINGSALTMGMGKGVMRLEDIGGKQIAVPHWYSMHNVILQLCLRQYGIKVVMQDQSKPLKPNETNLFVMKPPDMPTAMSQGAIDGYIVAEPFNAMGETLAHGQIVRFTGDVFKNHPCCVAVMNEKDITQHPEWAQKVVNGLVKSQKWLIDNREDAAHILSKDGDKYLPMPSAVVKRALTKYDTQTYGVSPGHTGAIRHPEWDVKRIGFQPYPYESATREIVNLLKQTRVGGNADFLRTLDPEQVVKELVNYDLVKRAVESKEVGGLKVFEGVDPNNPYIRTEIIKV